MFMLKYLQKFNSLFEINAHLPFLKLKVLIFQLYSYKYTDRLVLFSRKWF